MKKLLLAITVLSVVQAAFSQESHEEFLTGRNTTAKEYIINTFRKYDIVILCERHHAEFTQYELFYDIVSDPYFIENVGHIFTEVGSSNMDSRINSFLRGNETDDGTVRDSVTAIFRDIADVPYWHPYSYPWFLSRLHGINMKLEQAKKISLHPSDRKFDWYAIKTTEDYISYENSYPNRDSLMAANIIDRLEGIKAAGDGRGKALVVMNYKHAFLKDHKSAGEHTTNTGRWLSDRYGDKTASVYIMESAIDGKGGPAVVKQGGWDRLFIKTGKTDIGFNLAGSPFGEDTFDAIPYDPVQNFTYEEMFTGIIYYKPPQEQRIRTGWEGFAADGFIPELRRRIEIFLAAQEPDAVNEPGRKYSSMITDDLILKNNIEKEEAIPDLEAIMKLIRRQE